MNIHKFLLAFLLFLFAFVNANAQYEEFEGNSNNNSNNSNSRSQWFMDHFTFGGNVGFGFGDVLYVEANPCIGYRFNNYFTAGVTGTYEYYKYDYDDVSKSIYGGGVFAEAYPFNCIIVRAEAQYINFENYCDGYYYYSDAERMWDMPVLVGAGYRRQISDRISFNLMLLWNLNNTNELKYNVYQNPIVRLSLMF